MASPEVLEPIVLDTIERYFDLLQAHVPGKRMLAEVLTPDFETGFVAGLMWRGPDGLQEFLAARSVFFDESHHVLQLMDVTRADEVTIRARTRLRFFLRRREDGAAVSEDFTGDAFHTWLLRRTGTNHDWRVAAQLVDGFAALNPAAAALFSTPTEGLRM